MKLLLINPNTSRFVTERTVACARAVAGEGVEITGVTGECGPPIVGSRAGCALAAAEVLRLAAEHAGDCDSVLLAISFDTGLDALREMLDIPVIGMSEAGMLAAMCVSRKFSMITFGDRAAPLYSEMIEHYGLAARSAGVIALPALSQAELEDTTLILPQLADRIEQAVVQDGTESVVLAGAVFAGIADALSDRVSVPVIDGIAAGVHMLTMLHAMHPKKPARGSLSRPPAQQLSGLSEGLGRLFGDRS